MIGCFSKITVGQTEIDSGKSYGLYAMLEVRLDNDNDPFWPFNLWIYKPLIVILMTIDSSKVEHFVMMICHGK